MNIIPIKFQKLVDSTQIPKKATSGSAGYDIHACIDKPIIIQPMERILIPTGFAVQIPNNYEIQIRGRSGLAIKHGIIVLNSPGTIDSDYCDEVKVMLINLSNTNFTITENMRIAQMIIASIVQINFEIVESLPQSSRKGGFGSTGLC